MTAGCGISHNSTTHIKKHNLNTQSNEMLQINPYGVDAVYKF